jgi:sRNA-binding regulator protein Hfq
MHGNAIDQALEGYASGKTEVEATLKDGSVVRGRIMNFDGYVIFMDGGSGQMLYRHSLLKIAPAKEARTSDAQTQPAEKPRRERFQVKPDARQNAQQQKNTRPPRPKPQERKPQVAAQEDTGRIGSMGEAMQKWLQSQKG